MADEDVKYVDAVEVVKGNGNAVFNHDKALITQMMEWAWSHPRNLKKVIANCTAIVTMDVDTAAACTYNLPKGDGVIGPSVHLARIIARQMGNMRVEQRVLAIEERQVICEAMCFDLETNFAVKTEVRRSIWGKRGRYSEDMIVTTGAAGTAIAFRNSVFAVVDPDIVKKIHDISKKRVTGDLSDETKLVAKRTLVINGFKTAYQQYGLTEEEICRAVKRKLVDHINADDVLKLIGYENALKSGDASFEDIFRPAPLVHNPPPDKSVERMETLLKAAKTRKDLEKLKPQVTGPELSILYDEMWNTLK